MLSQYTDHAGGANTQSGNSPGGANTQTGHNPEVERESKTQGQEFAHWFSEQITRILPKNE